MFYDAWATNHPGGHASATGGHTVYGGTGLPGTRGPSRPCPNWFRYGQEVANGTPYLGFALLLYDSTMPADTGPGMDPYGQTPGIAEWLYYREEPSAVLIGDLAYQAARPLGDGRTGVFLNSFLAVVAHESVHVQQIEDFNASSVPFYDGRTGRIGGAGGIGIYDRCEDMDPVTSRPCGWAFADHTATILSGHYYWNRYQDVNRGGGFEPGMGDLNLDLDGDMVPEVPPGHDPHFDPAAGDLEPPAYASERAWDGRAESTDWGCPGGNWMSGLPCVR